MCIIFSPPDSSSWFTQFITLYWFTGIVDKGCKVHSGPRPPPNRLPNTGLGTVWKRGQRRHRLRCKSKPPKLPPQRRAPVQVTRFQDPIPPFCRSLRRLLEFLPHRREERGQVRVQGTFQSLLWVGGRTLQLPSVWLVRIDVVELVLGPFRVHQLGRSSPHRSNVQGAFRLVPRRIVLSSSFQVLARQEKSSRRGVLIRTTLYRSF